MAVVIGRTKDKGKTWEVGDAFPTLEDAKAYIAQLEKQELLLQTNLVADGNQSLHKPTEWEYSFADTDETTLIATVPL